MNIGKVGCGSLFLTVLLGYALHRYDFHLGTEFPILLYGLLLSIGLAFIFKKEGHLKHLFWIGGFFVFVFVYEWIKGNTPHINILLSMWVVYYLTILGDHILILATKQKENGNTPEEKEPEQPMRK